jgi:serine/threonine protein kinase
MSDPSDDFLQWQIENAYKRYIRSKDAGAATTMVSIARSNDRLVEYRLDFRSHRQTNLQTGKSREIRRVPSLALRDYLSKDLKELLVLASEGNLYALRLILHSHIHDPLVHQTLGEQQEIEKYWALHKTVNSLSPVASSSSSALAVAQYDPGCFICNVEQVLDIPSTHIPPEELSLDLSQTTGSGGEADVFSGTFHSTGPDDNQRVVAKQFKVSPDSREDSDKANSEMQKLMFLSHCTLFPKCFGHTLAPQEQYQSVGNSLAKKDAVSQSMLVVLEHACYGDLEKVLKTIKEKNGHLDGRFLSLQLQWMFTIAEALKAMHALHLKHLDVKPKNVLVFDKFEVKLADLGVTSVECSNSSIYSRDVVIIDLSGSSADDEDTMTMAAGTLGYRAPLSERLTIASDVYSLGMTCVHIINFQRPQSEGWLLDVSAAKTALQDSIYLTEVSEMLTELITRCTEKDPSKRPTASYCSEKLGLLLEHYPVTADDISSLNNLCF